jgi:hypothetical protein
MTIFSHRSSSTNTSSPNGPSRPYPTATGAAFVRHASLHHALDSSRGVHLKHGLDVQLCCLAADIEGNHRTALHNNIGKGTESGHLKSGEGLMATVMEGTGMEEAQPSWRRTLAEVQPS